MKWIAGIAVYVGLMLVFTRSKASQVATPGPGLPTAEATPFLITKHDAAWDYKLEDGRWYTRRKADAPGGKWLDMQQNLSAANYKIAIDKLEAYIKNGGI